MSVYVLIEEYIPLQFGGGFRPVVTIKGVYATLEAAQAAVTVPLFFGWRRASDGVWKADSTIASVTAPTFKIREFTVNS